MFRMQAEMRSLFYGNTHNIWKTRWKTMQMYRMKRWSLHQRPQSSWDFHCRCYSEDDIWHATAKGTAIAQLGACSQKCNPSLDLKWMEDKMCRQAHELQRGRGAQKPPELSISHQPVVDLYARIEAVRMALKNCSFHQYRMLRCLLQVFTISEPVPVDNGCKKRGGLFPTTSSASNNDCN